MAGLIEPIKKKDNIGESIEQLFALLLQEVESPLVKAFFDQGDILEGKMDNLLVDTTQIAAKLDNLITLLTATNAAFATANAHLAAIETNTNRIP